MSTSTSEGEILTIKQVADYLKVTERTIYRLAAAKKIPAFKVGGTWRFWRADIDSWAVAGDVDAPVLLSFWMVEASAGNGERRACCSHGIPRNSVRSWNRTRTISAPSRPLALRWCA